jgi:flagellar basal body rod protein FlgB
MDVLGIAQQGLQQAEGQFDYTARRIAQTGTNTSTSSQTAGDSVSLSDNMVSLLSAKTQYETDLGLAKTAGEMQKATLNLLA